MRTLNHIGVVTTTPAAGECYNEGMKVWLTDFSTSPNKIESLRFEAGSWLPELIQTKAHIAYQVDSIAKELEGAKILIEPFDAGDGLTIAFIEEEGVAIELMEYAS
ncbi:MAG: hypothetical protein SNJ33_05105 [Rikenellaceae bacterium]